MMVMWAAGAASSRFLVVAVHDGSGGLGAQADIGVDRPAAAHMGGESTETGTSTTGDEDD